MLRIADPEDPRIAPYAAIRDRDLSGRPGCFVAEGEVVLRVLLGQSRLPIQSIFLLDSRVEKLAPLLDDLPDDVPVYVAARRIMDRIVGFPIHRGILAIGGRGSETSPRDLLGRLPAASLVIGLIGIANHDNVGGIFRNATAFGADAVLLDAASCDPLYRKAIRVSVGASLIVPFARAGPDGDMVGELLNAGFEIAALSPRGRIAVDDVRWGTRVALLFGSEGHGLPADILSRVPSVRIAMAGRFDSLNVAAASAIALHRVRSARLDR